MKHLFIGFCSQGPAVKSIGIHSGHVLEPSPFQTQQLEGQIKLRQVGAGQGAEDGKGQCPNTSQEAGWESSYRNCRECKLLQNLTNVWLHE